MRRKIWIMVLAAVALVGCGSDDSDEKPAAAETVSESPSTPSESADADVEESEPEAEAKAKPEDEPEVAEAGTQKNPLPLGQTFALDDEWTVAIVSFTPDATDQIRAENQFNEPPADGSVYSLVRLRATYTGAEQGTAGFALQVGYVGSDARVYVDSDCDAVEPDGMIDQPDLATGGTAEANLCLELPTAILGTGALFVEPLMSFDDVRAWWREI